MSSLHDHHDTSSRASHSSLVTYLQLWVPPCAICLGCRSPSPAASVAVVDEDYRRQLQGGGQDQDWSTVDKKKDRKGKAAPKVAEVAAGPGPPASTWDTDDGWEDAGPLLDPKPDVPPKPDPSTSPSEHNNGPLEAGSEAALSSGRSDSDVQCDKCGKWGHPAAKCTEEFCDRCQQKGHSIKNCKQHQRGGDSGRGWSGQDRGREGGPRPVMAVGPNIQCHRCGEWGHRQSQCHLPDPRASILCYRCQQYGHTAPRCPNPAVPRPPPRTAPPIQPTMLTDSQRHADAKGPQPLAGPSHAPEQREQHQQQSKGRGRGSREQQQQQQQPPAEGSSATLPLPRDQSVRSEMSCAQADFLLLYMG